MQKEKLDKAVFRYIEYELYNYESTKKEIEFLREQIMNSSPRTKATDEEQVQGGQQSNPTEQKGMRLTTNAVLLNMIKVVECIDNAFRFLDEEHHTIYQKKYKEGKHWQQIITEMPISQDTYFRKRREIVYAVAVQMGKISPD